VTRFRGNRYGEGTHELSHQAHLGCRMHQATLAATDTTRCSSAGRFGGETCQATTLPNKACEAFCTIAQAVCSGIDKQFADFPTGMGNCQGNHVANVSITASGPSTGASFECNAHILLEATDALDPNCQRIVMGSPPCQ
jgi:hypothetical protein